MNTRSLLVALALCVVAHEVSGTSYLLEEFLTGLKGSSWIASNWKKDEGIAGKFGWSAGKFFADEKISKGAMTTQDARFYAMSRALDKVGNNQTFTNEGKDLVLQFSLKWPQGMDCGGGYIKLFREGIDQKTVSGDTDYAIMFGPDVCGHSTRKVHVIFNYKGKNLLCKKDIKCEIDRFTHVYTLIVRPDNTYEVRIDGEKKEGGNLADDWDFLPPKMIKDPEAKKPDDWVDEEYIDDPNDVKPDDWDDIPRQIPDPDAEEPEDWDEDADGEWTAPLIDNPDFEGEWKAKSIKNPEWKGVWEHPMIANPDYEEDDTLYLQKDIAYAGFELWQVKSGSVFDNIIVTDTISEAEDLLERTFFALRDDEKKHADDIEAEERRKTEAARKAAEGDKEEEEDDFEDEDEVDKDEL